MSDGDRCEQLVTVRYPKATLRCLLPEGHKEIHSFDVQRPASLAQLAPIREAWLNEGPVPKYHRDWQDRLILAVLIARMVREAEKLGRTA